MELLAQQAIGKGEAQLSPMGQIPFMVGKGIQSRLVLTTLLYRNYLTWWAIPTRPVKVYVTVNILHNEV